MYNKTLLDLARYTINRQLSEFKKEAIDPAGMTPGGGGPTSAGGDPSNTVPMDPAAMAAANGVPPAGGGGMGTDPETMRNIIRQEMAAGGGGGPGGPGGGGKPAKPDIATVAMDVFQIKKLITYLMNMFQIPLPPEIIDGPNRHPATGEAMMPNAPGSTSDPSQQSQPQTTPGAIKPIEPIQPALPQVKSGSNVFDIGKERKTETFGGIYNKATALAKLASSLKAKQGKS